MYEEKGLKVQSSAIVLAQLFTLGEYNEHVLSVSVMSAAHVWVGIQIPTNCEF